MFQWTFFLFLGFGFCSAGKDLYEKAKVCFEQYPKGDHTDAIGYLREAADVHQFPEALSLLAEFHLFGRITGKPNFLQARRYLELLSLMDSMPANCHFYLAFIYHYELAPVETDEVDAIRARTMMHLKIASQTDDLARLALAQQYFLASVRHPTTDSLEQALLLHFDVAHKVSQREDFKLHPGRSYPNKSLFHPIEDRPVEETMKKLSEEVQYHEFTSPSDPEHLIRLGVIYYFGASGLPDVNYAKAFEYFKMASDEDHPLAHAYMGYLYMFGHGVDQDLKKSLAYFKRGGQQFHPSALAGLARLCIEYGGQNGIPSQSTEIVSNLTVASELESAEAMYQLACIYLSKGPSKVHQKLARKYLQKAAGHGHVRATFELGRVSLEDSLTKPENPQQQIENYKARLTLFKAVSQRGYGYLLSEAYEELQKGKTEVSIVRYLLASFCGYRIASENAALLFEKEGTEISYQRAFVLWKEMAVSKDNIWALMKLGDYYFYGYSSTYVARDYLKAMECYSQANLLKNPQASYNVGYCLEYGYGSPVDLYLAKRSYDLIRVYEPRSYLLSMFLTCRVTIKILYKYDWKQGLTDIYATLRQSFQGKQEDREHFEVPLKWLPRIKNYFYQYRFYWFLVQQFLVLLLLVMTMVYYLRLIFGVFRGNLEDPLVAGMNNAVANPNVNPEQPRNEAPNPPVNPIQQDFSQGQKLGIGYQDTFDTDDANREVNPRSFHPVSSSSQSLPHPLSRSTTMPASPPSSSNPSISPSLSTSTPSSVPIKPSLEAANLRKRLFEQPDTVPHLQSPLQPTPQKPVLNLSSSSAESDSE